MGLLLFGHTLRNFLVFLCLFRTIAGDDPAFLGCYQKHAGLELNKKVHVLTVNNCVEACEVENKAFALLASVQCFCSNSKDEQHVVENAKCSLCPADETKMCGGHDIVAYYKTNVEGKKNKGAFDGL